MTMEHPSMEMYFLLNLGIFHGLINLPPPQLTYPPPRNIGFFLPAFFKGSQPLGLQHRGIFQCQGCTSSGPSRSACAYLECKIVSRMDASDHWVGYAEVLGGDVASGSATAAVHHRKVATYYWGASKWESHRNIPQKSVEKESLKLQKRESSMNSSCLLMKKSSLKMIDTQTKNGHIIESFLPEASPQNATAVSDHVALDAVAKRFSCKTMGSPTACFWNHPCRSFGQRVFRFF